MNVLHQFRDYLTRPHVRPWALAAPIVVLLTCLPLLRPLRHPDPRLISEDELNRLATIQSVAEHRSLAIENSIFVPTSGIVRKGKHVFSKQPPTLAFLLAGPYWIMQRFGLTFAGNAALVAYLLTLIGATIPVALGAGLIYRLGRLFELPRPKRMLLAFTVALGSGLLSYGVVINAQAPAAALLLGSAACIAHVAISKRPGVTSGWLAVAGMAAMLAAVIEPNAVVFAVLLAATTLAMRWRVAMRIGGLALYALGACAPLLLHAQLVRPITGDMLPPQFHHRLIAGAATPAIASPDDDDAAPSNGWWDVLGRNLARIGIGLFGSHGIFSHFPVVIFGLLGMSAVMHRHWPITSKTLATATVVGAAAVIFTCCAVTLAGTGKMFGPQAFVFFLPLVLLWAGAWLRRKHHPATWTVAGVLLAFSALVSLIGATDPFPRNGYDRYTVAQAISNLAHAQANPSMPILAGR